jgi:hypothetical protein
MPENIAKVCRPSNRKNNEERKGSGSWYYDTEEERFNHIKRELSRYCDNEKDYDFLDLQWHIKNAVIGDIFFSEEVYKGINNGIYLDKYFGKNTDRDSIVQGIIKGNTRKNDGCSFDEKYLEIYKFKGGKLIFEHIVPTKLYVDELIRAYKNREFNIEYFRNFRKNIFVCIVTKEEDCRLGNKLRENMPNGIIWEPGKNTFARYEKVGIKIHGRD